MANRRCSMSLLTRFHPSLRTCSSLETLNPSFPQIVFSNSLHFPRFKSPDLIRSNPFRFFSSSTRNSDQRASSHIKEEEDDDDEEDGEEEDEEDYYEECEDDEDEEENSDADDNVSSVSRCVVERADVTKENEDEAAAIGYKVIGPLDPSEKPFKPWERVYAVVQIGSHQFKVCNGDAIFTERLKFCQVNDKLILNRVLMLGSNSQTMIGRPILPDAAVHAVVEEHALDAKVIIFKKKRRKNYRRTKGHRQELTKLRITDIQGIEKPQPAPTHGKPQPAATHGSEKPQPEAISA